MSNDIGKYNSIDITSKWLKKWDELNLYSMDDRPYADNYSIILPPPNITGSLHMGHAFNHCIIDILCRYHRMLGYNVLLQPGTDHAGIVTQILVEKSLEKDQNKYKLGREDFISKIWDWKDANDAMIKSQMQVMGLSCDWSRMRFTMDQASSELVSACFIKLYEDDLIYKGLKLVNWDPSLLSAISDLEVEHTLEQTKLSYISYPIEGEESLKAIIATTRPETIFADSAIAVHPKDHRYKDLVGKMAIIPISNRSIPIIADEMVDMKFGSGMVKITPAHDFKDYETGLRHGLEFISVLDEHAKIQSPAPDKYIGKDIAVARRWLVADLKELGYLIEQKDHKSMIARGDRSGEIIEPRLTEQWFLKLSSKKAKTKIIDKILDFLHVYTANSDVGVSIYPDQWINTYKQWLNNIGDWCISRQIWWGHRLPIWYGSNNEIMLGSSESAVREKYNYNGELRQETDVLDTWFSSALWPLTSLNWHPDTGFKNKEEAKYFPTSILVTGFDIIFFWVIRMLIMSIYFTGKVPFRTTYIHGLIRDRDGKKMSKSKGNVIDPLDVIGGIDLDTLIHKRISGLKDLKQKKLAESATKKEFPNGITAVGVDALRFNYASIASPGRDLAFDINRCTGYRNFCNKLWNAARFTLLNISQEDLYNYKEDHSVVNNHADRYIIYKLDQLLVESKENIDKLRLDWLTSDIHHFVWDEFCSWYMEMSKIGLKQYEVAESCKHTIIYVISVILKIMHPIMPFITEELWSKLRPSCKSISFESYPKPIGAKIYSDSWVNAIKKITSTIRNYKKTLHLPSDYKFELVIFTNSSIENNDYFIKLLSDLSKVSNIECRTYEDIEEGCVSIMESMKYKLKNLSILSISKRKKDLDKKIARLQLEVLSLNYYLNDEEFLSRAPKGIINKHAKNLEIHKKEIQELEEEISIIYSAGFEG